MKCALNYCEKWKKKIKKLKNWAKPSHTHRERNNLVASWKCNNNFEKTTIIITIQFTRSSNNWAINKMANCQCNKSFDKYPTFSICISRPISRYCNGGRERKVLFYFLTPALSRIMNWTNCICIWFCILPPFLVSLFISFSRWDKHKSGTFANDACFSRRIYAKTCELNMRGGADRV